MILKSHKRMIDLASVHRKRGDERMKLEEEFNVVTGLDLDLAIQ